MCASSSEWGAHAGPSNHISDLANTSHSLVGGHLGRAEELQTPRGGPSPEACLRKAGSATVASQAGSHRGVCDQGRAGASSLSSASRG